MKGVLFFIAVCTLCTAFSQADENSPDITWDQMQDLQAGTDVETFDLRKRDVIFRVFFDEQWLDGWFISHDLAETTRSTPIKYDILNQEINFLIGDQAYVMPKENVKGFVLNSVAGGNFKQYEFVVLPAYRKKNKLQIYEMAVKGEYSLLVEHDAEKNAADYIPSLDIGSVSEDVNFKTRYYVQDTDGELHKVKGGHRAGRKLFSGFERGEGLVYDDVDFKNREDLINLVTQLNE
jgi:hypothetical protein